MKIRGEPNILLVGDPGTAKSQMLQYVSRIAPRGLYTSGKGTTAAGLTAAVLRDSETGDFSLEAGALVLADRGIACIDEFDKMNPDDRVAIHEAMEQQTVSIAKAGIISTLNARTAILAAANPSLGRYNEYQTPTENINLPVTILSRFDLLFIITDKPEKEADKRMADHIIKLHKDRVVPVEAPIQVDLLRKFVSWSKITVFPKLSTEAGDKLEEFYLEMRATGEAENAPVPITPRQLEALVRLAEARARMALREEVSAADAEAVVRLMKESLRQVGLDRETGLIDIDRIVSKPKSLRDKLTVLLDVIKELEKEFEGDPVPIDRVLESAEERHLDKSFAQKAIEQLKREGSIYEPKPGYVKKA